MELPLYELMLMDSADGVFKVSIVDEPAIESDFMLFKKDTPVDYTFADETKHVITGAVMVPDKKIYRRDEDGFEYNVFFSKDTIEHMLQKFMKMKTIDAVSLQHSVDLPEGAAYIFESYLVDRSKGINPEFLGDLPDGTWVASMKIEDDALWSEIKNTDLLHGFSVEVHTTPVKTNPENKFQKNTMNKFLEFLKSLVSKFGDVQTDKGHIYWEGDYDLKAGDKVYLEDADGNYVDAPEGEYVTPDNKTIKVDGDGMVTEIQDPDAEVEASAQEPEATVESAEKSFAEEADPADPGADSQDTVPVELETVLEQMETLASTVEDLSSRVDELKALVDQVLAAPQAEPAFSAVRDDAYAKDKKNEISEIALQRLSYLKKN